MTGEWVLMSAFAVGLFGSGHCLGMCGGIAGAFHASAADQTARRTVFHLLFYNGGRIVSYSLAGALAGALSFTVGALVDLEVWSRVLRAATGGLIALIGLHLLFGLRSLLWLENLGRPVWRRLAPLVPRVRPHHSGQWGRWFGLGMLWGWLPCGMVYSVLLIALMAGSAVNGALIMLSFGLGTLPAMLLTGVLTARGGHWLNSRHLARYTGVLCLVLGLWTAAAPRVPVPSYPQHALSANQLVCSRDSAIDNEKREPWLYSFSILN